MLAKEADLKHEARVREGETIAHRVLRTVYCVSLPRPVTSDQPDVFSVRFLDVLKKPLPREQFEELSVLLKASGANVGEENHSAMRMTKFRDAFFDEMLTIIKRHVVSQPCVAVTTDKVTLNRRYGGHY